ncbi:MAG: CHAT domain-containing protein, partial [Spirulinaceae cyanobacterium RM2_2_10]|nr:CHAT domain-containing protein [Spirulinaceae cyanobacterium RM2_2_10]
DNSRLQQARQVVEELQVAELEDFLRCQLQFQNAVALDRYVDQGDTNTAVIYPIAIGDRLGLIAKLPQQTQLIYRTSNEPDTVAQLATAILELRDSIEEGEGNTDMQPSLSKAYQLLIKPLEAALAASPADTLVFVLDSAFRNLPLAALYDAERGEYLLERYNVALNLGLELPVQPPLQLEQAAILAAGVIKENCIEGMGCAEPLPAVKDELDAIEQQLPQAQVLRDEAFGAEALRTRLKKQGFRWFI